MSNLNAVVPSIMFKMILPRMQTNKMGLCNMIGSAAGMAPFATLPLYGATKSFVHHLTKFFLSDIVRKLQVQEISRKTWMIPIYETKYVVENYF